jgi:hypothetical protein
MRPGTGTGPGRAPMVGLVAGLAAAVVLLGACGVPVDPDDRVVRGNIPPDLLVPLATTTTTSTVPVPVTVPPGTVAGTPAPVDYPLDLYFADGLRVVRVKRRIGLPPTPDIAVEYLALGPRSGEDPALSTAVVDSSLIASTIGVRDGRAEVELTDEFERLTSTQQFQLFNQLIATLTALPGVGVGAVQFFRRGDPISVLRPDGSLAVGAQTRDDIAEFIVEDPRPSTGDDASTARNTIPG